MKIDKNTQGFAVVEAVLIFVIVGLIGFVGWYVWHARQNVEKLSTPTNNSASQQSKKAAEDNIYQDWKSYVGSDFSAKYPTKWSVVEADLGGADSNLAVTHFSTGLLEKDKEPSSYNALITVSVFHNGYYIGDVDGKGQLLSSSIEAATFARNMNGLAPNELFKQVNEEMRTIGGQKAIKYVGGKFDTPWTLRSDRAIYQFQNIQGKDITKAQQDKDFSQFLDSVKVL